MIKNKLYSKEISIWRVHPNPEQPRKQFDQAELKELADSIREHGVIQPIAVEEAGLDFILHDGERRWRAPKMAGLTVIPALIIQLLNGTGPQERLTRALVANIQHAAMTPVEEALALKRLNVEHKLSIREISKRTGRPSKS